MFIEANWCFLYTKYIFDHSKNTGQLSHFISYVSEPILYAAARFKWSTIWVLRLLVVVSSNTLYLIMYVYSI